MHDSGLHRINIQVSLVLAFACISFVDILVGLSVDIFAGLFIGLFAASFSVWSAIFSAFFPVLCFYCFLVSFPVKTGCLVSGVQLAVVMVFQVRISGVKSFPDPEEPEGYGALIST